MSGDEARIEVTAYTSLEWHQDPDEYERMVVKYEHGPNRTYWVRKADADLLRARGMLKGKP